MGRRSIGNLTDRVWSWQIWTSKWISHPTLIILSGRQINITDTPLRGLLSWVHVAQGKILRHGQVTLALLYLGGCSGRGRRKRGSKLLGRGLRLDDVLA